MRSQAEVDSANKEEQLKHLNSIQDFIMSQPTTVTEFDETLVRRLIGKIIVYEDRFSVEFKSGLSTDIRV